MRWDEGHDRKMPEAPENSHHWAAENAEPEKELEKERLGRELAFFLVQQHVTSPCLLKKITLIIFKLSRFIV